jgi:hypothetical protein
MTKDESLKKVLLLMFLMYDLRLGPKKSPVYNLFNVFMYKSKV